MLDSLKIIIDRESKVIGICRYGIDSYKENLERLKVKSERFMKRKLRKDIEFLIKVVEGLQKGLKEIHERHMDIFTLQRRVGKFGRPNYEEDIENIIKQLKKEEGMVMDIISRSKPKKLGKIRSSLLGVYESWQSSRSIVKLKGLIDYEKTSALYSSSRDREILDLAKDARGAFSLLILVPVSVIESLINVMYGLSQEDKEIREEIDNFKGDLKRS